MNLDQLPDLTDWRNIEVWTLEEAAMIWAALEPMEYEGKRIKELKGSVSAGQYLKARIYLRAAQEAVCGGTLSFVEAWEEHIDEDGNCWSNKIEFPKLPSHRHISPDMTRVQQAAFIKWAQGKQIYSLRQILTKAKKSQIPEIPASDVLDVVEVVKVKEAEPVLLLAGASALDTNHPKHAVEVGLAAKAWEIAMGLGGSLPGKTAKQTIRHVLDNYQEFSHLANDAKDRISISANYNKKGGTPPTPQKEEPTHLSNN